MKKSSRHGANFGFGADIIHTSKTLS